MKLTRNQNFVYVICASPADHFAEMAAVSMASLRLVHPNASIVAVMDDATFAGDTPGISAIRDVAQCVVPETNGFGTPLLKSRYLKTNLRRIIEGDFVFLDSDTIILRPLNAIWETAADIAAAPDLDEEGRPYSMTEVQRELFTQLDWAPFRGHFLNAGVFLMRDNDATRSLADALAQDWRHFVETTGKPNDQLAFNHVLFRTARSTMLPTRFNAQIRMNPLVARGAHIAHIFSGRFDELNDTVLHVLSKRLKVEGHFDTDLLRDAIAAGHVWTELDSMKKCLATGQPWKVAGLVVRKIAGRAPRQG